MTKALSRLLKISNLIKTGKADVMKLFDFCQSLNAIQARDLMNEIDFCQSLNAIQARDLMNEIFCHVTNRDDAMKFFDAFLPMLREHVAKDLIRESMRHFADCGLGSLVYDKNGNIDGIHITPEQEERINAYLEAKKGGAA